jgi:hypothetical protein
MGVFHHTGVAGMMKMIKEKIGHDRWSTGG